MQKIRQISLVLACAAALGAVGYGQYGIRLNPDDARSTALLLAGAAVAALLLGLGDTREEPRLEPLAPRNRLVRTVAALGVLAGLALAGTGSTLLTIDWRGQLLAGWSVLLGGVALLSLGLRASDPPRDPQRSWSWTEVAVLLAIVLLGAALRFYRYTEFPDPFAIHAIEEPQTGMGGYAILTRGSRPWEFMVDHYVAALAIYLTNDPSILSIRLPFTIFSTLTIIPVYFVLRQVVARPAAYAGTFLFAVSSWNIIYSRVAHNIFLTNFFVVIALGLLIHFGRTRRLAGIPWAGLLCGYTLYAYAGYRGTTLFALVFLAGVFLRDIRRFTRAAEEPAKIAAARAVLRDLGAGALTIALVVALFAPVFAQTSANRAQPLYYFEAANRSLANTDYYTSDRAQFLRQRLDRVRDTARIFMHKGDGSDTFNAPDEPMLDPVTASCFLGGLLLAVWFPLRQFNGFLLFMFLGLLFGGAVFVQNLDVRRLQGVTPFVAIFAALFLDRLWAFVRRAPRRLVLAVVPLLALGGAAFTTWWNYDVYFNKMAHDRRVRQAFKNFYTSLIQFGRVHGGGRELLVLTYIHSFFRPSDYYWLVERDIHGRTLSDLTEILPPHPLPRGDRPPTIVIQNPYARDAIARLLTSVYPGLRCSDFVDPDNPYVAVSACDVPQHLRTAEWRTTLEARYWIGPAAGDPLLMRPEPFIDFALVPPPCYSEPRPGESEFCTGEWQGTVDAPVAGTYVFTVRTRDRTAMTVHVDGHPAAGTMIHLEAGSHQILAQARIPRTGDTGARLEWTPPTGGSEVTPFYTTVAGEPPAP